MSGTILRFFKICFLFIFLFLQHATAQPVTLFVSASGDDDQNGVSQSTALETFQAASEAYTTALELAPAGDSGTEKTRIYLRFCEELLQSSEE